MKIFGWFRKKETEEEKKNHEIEDIERRQKMVAMQIRTIEASIKKPEKR